MRNFSRKAILGGAAVITAATTAFMMAGAANAAAATPAAPAAHAVPTIQAAPDVPLALVWPLVQQGNTGQRVVAIQNLLNQQIGAGLATDGIFGPLTAAAVRNFQARHGLLVDGKVGNQTWPVLIIQVQRGNTGSAVRGVQSNLRFSYGFTSLAVDGIFGPMTQSAVRTFQSTHHVNVDGIVGTTTWNQLVVHEP